MSNKNVIQDLVRQMKTYIKTGIVLLCLIFSTPLIADNLTSQELKKISEDTNSIEKKLLNIKIESETWVELKSQADSCEIWEKTPVSATATAWFDSPKNKKGRINFNKLSLKWVDGASDHIDHNYTVAFDGQFGKRIDHTNIFNNKTFNLNKGELSSDVPEDLTEGASMMITGRRFTLFFTTPANSDISWPKFFNLASEKEPSLIKFFDFTMEEFMGIQCIKVSTEKSRGWGKIYWIDPARGYSLIGFKSTGLNKDNSERLITSFKVTQLKEVAPGVWWPMEAIEESASLKPGEPNHRTIYRASSVIANDPNFNKNIFSPSFPKGYNVNDKIKGKTYIVDSNNN